RAHDGLAAPRAALVVIDREYVVVAGDEAALEKRLAGICADVPPPFARPALGVLVAEGDADAAFGVVAELEIGFGRGKRHPHACGGCRERADQLVHCRGMLPLVLIRKIVLSPRPASIAEAGRRGDCAVN